MATAPSAPFQVTEVSPGIQSIPGVSTASPISTDPTGGAGHDSAWLSGLADLFQAAAGGIATGFRAANAPSSSPGSGWVYDRATNQYYNPITGQALTSTGTLTSAGGLSQLTSGNGLLLLILAVLGFLLLRPRRAT